MSVEEKGWERVTEEVGDESLGWEGARNQLSGD